MKTIDELAQVGKGIGHPRRVRALLKLSKQPGLTLTELADLLETNVHTAGEHLRRLEESGLINNHHDGLFAHHALTNLGKRVVNDLKTWS